MPEAQRAEALSEVEGATEAVPRDGRTERVVEGPRTSQIAATDPGNSRHDAPLTWGKKYPKLQILTIAELLERKELDYPRSALDVTFKKAPKAKSRASQSKTPPGTDVPG